MKLTAVLFTIFIILVIVLADRGQLGPVHFIYDIPNGDKVGHFVLYGLLNFFITRASLASLPSRRLKLVALYIGLVLAVLISAEEWSQQFFPARTEDIFDLCASLLGVFVGGIAALKLKK